MDRSSIAAMRVSHMGKILSNFAILGAVICLASIAYFLLIAFYYILLVCVLLCTLFIILLYYPDFMDLFTNADTINNFMAEFTVKYLPVIAPVTVAVSAAAIALLVLSKQKNTERIVTASICLIIGLVFTAIFTLGGASQ